jgi:hypothetical protein
VFPIVFIAFFVGAKFAPMVFFGGFWLALIGMAIKTLNMPLEQ